MSELVLSPAGNKLVGDDIGFRSLVEEFALPKSRGIGGASYREETLGQGGEARVYSVRGFPVVERVAISTPSHPDYQVLASFQRSLRARDYWENARPSGSQLYIPEYFAAVQHSDANGAILLERVGHGVTVEDLMSLDNSGMRTREEIVGLLGCSDLDALSLQIGALFRKEESFFRELFRIAGDDDSEALPENMVVDYNLEVEGDGTIRLGAIDF